MVALASSSLFGSNSAIYSSTKRNSCCFTTEFPSSLVGATRSPQRTTRRKKKKLSRRLTVLAVTEGSSKSQEEEGKKEGEGSIPSWARPDSDEPPPWARGEASRNESQQGFQIPFYVYLLTSAVIAIAAIGSVFEYVNQRPVFGVLSSDSIFYAPLLGFFAFTGIPTSAPKACAEHELPGDDDKNGKRLKQVQRGQWLRAAILGASDGLLSTTSLMLGVGAAKEDQWYMILSGLAGAVAGACSMAVGEFVSVSCQRDIEKATIGGCSSSKTKLCEHDNGDDVKLNIITSAVGTTRIDTNPASTNLDLSPAVTPLRTILGKKLVCDHEKLSPFMTPATTPERKSPLVVASSKSPSGEEPSGDAKTALAQDGDEEEEEEEEETDALPNPYKAASVSALAFLGGSVVPLLPAMLFVHNRSRILVIVAVASIALALSGGIGAYLGGSSVRLSAVRVLLGGWISMAVTYGLLKPLEMEGKGHGDTD